MTKDIAEILNQTIQDLSHDHSVSLTYLPKHGKPMPSVKRLEQGVELLRKILFPGFFGDSSLKQETISYYLGVNMDKVFHILVEQIQRGLCFASCEKEQKEDDPHMASCLEEAMKIATKFIQRLPQIREYLSTDVKAAYVGDPAAYSFGEIIFAYPTIRVITSHRIAHELLSLGVPLLPRIISEMAHSETGIDIHPGAQIGKYFTIDHGTGVVIGETCIIGENVKIYQGVTLGAKSFPLDDDGNPIKGIDRHPIVKNNVVIYANATILGRISIGENTIIGGNVWVTQSVPPNSTIIQRKTRIPKFIDGAGI